MAKCKKFKAPEGLELNYENLYVFPANKEEYIALYGDTECTFKDFELEEICDKFNAVGCTSFQLSAEELHKIIEKLKAFLNYE